jgi:hypothetical protein
MEVNINIHLHIPNLFQSNYFGMYQISNDYLFLLNILNLIFSRFSYNKFLIKISDFKIKEQRQLLKLIFITSFSNEIRFLK